MEVDGDSTIGEQAQETEIGSKISTEVSPKQSDMAQASQDDASTSEKNEEPIFKAPMSIAPRITVKKKSGLVAQAFDETESTKEKDKTDTSPVSSDDSPSDPPKKSQATEKSKPEQPKQQLPVPYKEPSWGSLSTDGEYSFEVIKNGLVVSKVELNDKSYYLFGRLPSCDVTLEHPSLSRYHAVVQYCGEETERHDKGWYLYDLDSTHGTWVNKNKVKPRVYIRIRVGHVVKFGGSTRLFILQGPSDDQESESDLTVTEIKQQRERQKKEVEILRLAEIAEQDDAKQTTDDGCSWGMDDTDAVETNAENPFALNTEPENEHLYIADPKKALRGFFEREGLDLPEYDIVEEGGHGRYKCRVELPLYGSMGEPIVAEVSVSGKKREAVVACALEACRILDRHGELRKATHESRAKKRKNWEEDDFYGSDDDTFLDRTGDIEKKRKLRMQREKKSNKKAESYDSLMSKLADVEKEIAELEDKLKDDKKQISEADSEGMDVFDAYMNALKSGALDTKTRTKLKRQIFELKQDKMRLEKLSNIAKPALPGMKKQTSLTKFGAMFGRMKGPARPDMKPKLPVQSSTTTSSSKEADGEMVEEDEEEEEDKTQAVSSSSTEKMVTDTVEKVPKSTEKTIPSSSQEANQRLASDETGLNIESANSAMDTETSQDNNTNLIKSNSPVVDTTQQSETSSETQNQADSTQSKDSAPTTTTIAPVTSTTDSVDFIPQRAPPTSATAKKKKHKEPFKTGKKTSSSYQAVGEDPDYAMWTPPQGQSGDGKTHLNAKFGY